MEDLINDAELSKVEAEELVEEIRQCKERIKVAEAERDEFHALYQKKIERADNICEKLTLEERNRIAILTEQLRRFAEVHVTDKRRSVPLPTGTLAFRKQPPRFFFDDLKEANGKDERLIKFVKHNAHDYLKVKVEESVDWLRFKGKLTIEGENVCYADTGEIINGLHAEFQPDKFTVTTI